MTPAKRQTSPARKVGGNRSHSLEAPPVALSIAGFDPSSGAGITADLKTFAAHEVYGVACISAITVQSTLGVLAVKPLKPLLVRDTLACLAEDVSFSGIKIGMLGGGGVARVVARFLDGLLTQGRIARSHIVLDPILRSSSGRALLDRQGLHTLRSQLLRTVGWITPNLDELALMTGAPGLQRRQIPAAAARLQKMAANLGNRELNVVVTGGHLKRPDEFLLTADGKQCWLHGEMVHTRSTHGTGCAFSSALVCSLIAGKTPAVAAAQAKEYVTAALQAALPVGRGAGPMHHLFRLAAEGLPSTPRSRKK
jgi:hydroxymethylpyrimidine/phosphomethylpyrimidine kinase